MKQIFATLVIIAAVAVGLLLLLPALISTDWARSELGRKLSTASDMDVRLEGPVRLSFLPNLSVVAKDIAISSDNGDISVRVPVFSTSITLSSLWSDKLEIQSISMADPAIRLAPSSASTQKNDAGPDDGIKKNDPFASLVDTLERLAVNHISIENGSLTLLDAASVASKVEAIDMDLGVPDLDREVSFSMAATQDKRRVQLDGTLSALRPILQRKPAELVLQAQTDPAPSPMLASVKAEGEISLNENGSYQVRGGRFDLGGQAFTMDALFQPGERHHFQLNLAADKVDIGAISGSGSADTSSEKPVAGQSEPSLVFLSTVDAQVSVTIGELSSGRLAASDLQFSASLKNGKLDAQLKRLRIDAGSISASVMTNVAEALPTVHGQVTSAGLDIDALAKLAGQTIPMSGKVTIDTAFAFRGLTASRMMQSVNARGTVGIRGGRIPLAALTAREADKIGDVTNLSLDATIQDVTKPVSIAGKMTWQGEAVGFKTQISPVDFLSAPSIGNASGPVVLSVTSKHLNASVNGNIGTTGTFRGNTSVTSPSLDKLMRWIGQPGSAGLRDFAFDGFVDGSSKGVAFTKARVGLNGIKASGEGSLKFGSPLSIRTALIFDKLDFAAFSGQSSGATANTGAPAKQVDAPIDLSFLKDLDVRIDVAADKIGYGKVFAGPVKTSLVIAGGKAELTIPQSPFYGGTISADMTADGSGKTAAVKLAASVAGATAASLLNDAAGFNRLEGKLATSLAITGTGNTTKTLRRSLAGTASMKFSNGAVRGINIAEVYNNLVGLLAGGFKSDENKKTTFTELGATFNIDKGIAATSDISLLSPLVRMDGAGTIDLAEQTLAINLNPRVVASLSGQGGDIATKGIGVPVIIDGTLSAPRIYPDLSKLMQDPKGTLEMLGRLGLPTRKLGLDKLLPGETPTDETRDRVRDKIGDLINGSGKSPALGDLINGALSGRQPGQPAATPQQETTGSGQNELDAAPATGPAKGEIGELLNQILR